MDYKLRQEVDDFVVKGQVLNNYLGAWIDIIYYSRRKGLILKQKDKETLASTLIWFINAVASTALLTEHISVSHNKKLSKIYSSMMTKVRRFAQKLDFNYEDFVFNAFKDLRKRSSKNMFSAFQYYGEQAFSIVNLIDAGVINPLSLRDDFSRMFTTTKKSVRKHLQKKVLKKKKRAIKKKVIKKPIKKKTTKRSIKKKPMKKSVRKIVRSETPSSFTKTKKTPRKLKKSSTKPIARTPSPFNPLSW